MGAPTCHRQSTSVYHRALRHTELATASVRKTRPHDETSHVSIDELTGAFYIPLEVHRAVCARASFVLTPSAFLRDLKLILGQQGFAVGLVSLGLSLRLGATLILFYKSSSILTKVGVKKKAKLTDDYKVQRACSCVQ